MPVTRAAAARLAAEPPSPQNPSSTAPLDPYTQALKVLVDRSPFDEDDAVSRVLNLPAVLAKVQLKGSHGRKNHRKSYSESTPLGFWDSVEEFFRAVSETDVEKLGSAARSVSDDSCFYIPEIRGGSGDSIAQDLDGGSLSSVTEVEEFRPKCDEGSVVVEDVSSGGLDNGEGVVEDGDNSSLNWLLGARERFVVTSERPSKKRKLLGADAGLERLLLLPNLRMGTVCDFCCLGDSRVKSNKLLCCDCCKVSVHQKCYGVEAFEGVWLCEWCKNLEKTDDDSARDDRSPVCLFCPKEGGALKPVGRDLCESPDNACRKFAHLFCSLWAPEVYVEDTNLMDLIMDKGNIQDKHKTMVCDVCKAKNGVCIRCSHGTCRTSFHPLCARESKHQIEIWGKFGCDNIELRVFCLKHSTFKDTSNVMVGIQKDAKLTSVYNNLVAKLLPSPKVIPAKKLPKIRFTRSSQDKSRTESEDANIDLDETVKTETIVLHNSLPCMQESKRCHEDPALELGSEFFLEKRYVTNSNRNITVILRRLIDLGRIKADDFASEMGISSDILQSTLMDETTSFSPALTLKILNWLKCSTNVFGLQSSRLRSNAMKGDSPDSVEDTGPDGLCNATTGDIISDSVHRKSSPPNIITENKNQVVCDGEELISPKGNISPQNGDCKVSDDICYSSIAASDEVECHMVEARHCRTYEACFSEEQDPQEMTLLESHKASEHRRHPPFPGQEGNDADRSTLEYSDTLSDKFNIEERFLSSIPDKDQYGVAYATDSSALDKDCPQSYGHYTDTAFLTNPVGKVSSAGSFYIHPFIKKKRLHMLNHAFINQNLSEIDKNGLPFPFSISYLENLHKVSEARCVDILDHSPEDEVEGEMIYLQAILLDKTAIIRHRCDDLVSRIIQKLPEELNLINKQEWEFVLVNQYLHKLKQEAKKHGRKESRHKEAQTLLSTAAAPSASLRSAFSSTDANAEKDSTDQEIPSKINFRSRRAELHCPLVPRSKKNSRLASIKASLEKQGLVFQIPDFGKDSALTCEICMRTETVINRISTCSACKVTVHLDCYRRIRKPITTWKCEFCREMDLQCSSPSSMVEDGKTVSNMANCELCCGVSGAFRKSTDGQWVHAFCAEWLLESRFQRGQDNPIEGMETVPKKKDVCLICLENVGACIKCSYVNCLVKFHPLCARDAGFYMNVKSAGDCLEHKAYCEKHSIEKLEADSLQYHPEEHKNMKQMRVELEKLRLLLERIIKREKLKRDLILCSHNILASRRDSAARSVFLQSSFSPTRFSSESGITSVNNKSFSSTVQQSDDTTMGSTSSGKRTIKISLHSSDIERNTDEVSNFKVSIKRKLADRTLVGCNQLPQRSGSRIVEDFTEDGEQKLKTRKASGTFPKELVITSDQASLQNLRLPKGFAYVPADCISTELSTLEVETCERREPGG